MLEEPKEKDKEQAVDAQVFRQAVEENTEVDIPEPEKVVIEVMDEVHDVDDDEDEPMVID